MNRSDLIRLILGLAAALCALPHNGSAQVARDWPYNNRIRGPHFESEDLSRLHWVTGAWRVSMAGQPDSYEVVKYLNDSTMSITYYADPGLNKSTGDAKLYLSGGRIFEMSGPARWAASLIDGTGARFRPVENAMDEFTWMSLNADQWTETRRSGAVGMQRVVVSTMTRLK